MSDKTRTRRRANGAASEGHSTAAADNGTRTGDAGADSAVERWSFGFARECIADELGAGNALLRGSLALREMQIDAARRTQAMHAQATEQLQSATSVGELGSIGLMLARADAEAALRYWSDWAGIVAKSSVETMNEAMGAWTRAQGIAGTFGQQWLEAAAAARPDQLEAQVEHVTTPLTSSPFVMPAQEAVREAMTLGARNWSEWLGSTMPAMAKALQTAAAPVR